VSMWVETQGKNTGIDQQSVECDGAGCFASQSTNQSTLCEVKLRTNERAEDAAHVLFSLYDRAMCALRMETEQLSRCSVNDQRL
jgi:hypothetical protein